jgi:hypothetical protein
MRNLLLIGGGMNRNSRGLTADSRQQEKNHLHRAGVTVDGEQVIVSVPGVVVGSGASGVRQRGQAKFWSHRMLKKQKGDKVHQVTVQRRRGGGL